MIRIEGGPELLVTSTSIKTPHFSRRTFIGGSAIALITAPLVACRPDENIGFLEAQKKNIENMGLIGDLDLEDLASVPGFSFSGSASGMFFSFGASIKGESGRFIQFAWRSRVQPTKFFLSELPATKAEFELRDGAPQVNFAFDLTYGSKDKWIKWGPDKSCEGGESARSCRHILDSKNPNDYLIENRVDIATFKIAQKDFDRVKSTQDR